MTKTAATKKTAQTANETKTAKLGRYGITASMLYKLGMEKEPQIDKWATRPGVPRVMRAGFTLPTTNGPVPVYYIRDLTGTFYPQHNGRKSLVFVPAVQFTNVYGDADACKSAPAIHVSADDETGLEQVAVWIKDVIEWAEKNEVIYNAPDDGYCTFKQSMDIRTRIRAGEFKRHAAPLNIAEAEAEKKSAKAAKTAKRATKKTANAKISETAKATKKSAK